MIHLPAAGRYASYMYSRSGRNKKCDLAAEERLALRKKTQSEFVPPSFSLPLGNEMYHFASGGDP